MRKSKLVCGLLVVAMTLCLAACGKTEREIREIQEIRAGAVPKPQTMPTGRRDPRRAVRGTHLA